VGEEAWGRGGKKAVFGLICDSRILSGKYSLLIAKDKSRIESLHIIFMCRLTGTLDIADRPYHAGTV